MDKQPLGRSDPTSGAVPEKLVTVEAQQEFDVFDGTTETRIFVKLYVAARISGLLAEMSDRDWKTLCVLATYMNKEGFCYPSQSELSRAMGVSRQMANERIKSLARFRFRGKPVLLIEKGTRSEKGQWAKNGYRVLPISNLRIFNEDHSNTGDNEDRKYKGSTVSSKLDMASTTVSSLPDTVKLDTNKNQLINKKKKRITEFGRLETILRKYGVHHRTASRLVREYDAEFIQQKIEMVTNLSMNENPQAEHELGDCLRRVIEENYCPAWGRENTGELNQEADQTNHALWDQALEEIKGSTTRATYQSWFPQTQLLSLDDGQALIGVPDQATRDWLSNRLVPAIRRAVEGVAGREVELEFVVVDSA